MPGKKETQRKPKQKRSLETRNYIIEKSYELFSEKNYYEISINEIISFLGIPVGSFYAYFKDKKELFLQVLDYYDDKILTSLIQNNQIELDRDDNQIEKILLNIIYSHKSYYKLLSKIDAMSCFDDDIYQIKKKWDERSIIQIFTILSRDQTQNPEQIVEKNIDALVIYYLIETLINHLTNFADNNVNLDKVLNRVATMIKKYLT